MHKWFSTEIAEIMRKEIGVANENEVFFSATLDQGSLIDVAVVARGNRSSVPAVVRPVQGKRLVVIHNHPSGDVTPSGADITVASRLSRDGIGFAIINNEVTTCYVVVEPAELNSTVMVATKQVEEILAQGGLVARIMDAFETRAQQLDMAVNLTQALNNGEHALAEAGTGTGKSLAYLVPALLWAKVNKKRVVVSTNTINLQEQLLYKDIPLLQQAIPGSFKAVLVKGRANYLCKRKFIDLLQNGESLVDQKDVFNLQALAAWEQQTRDGSKSDLGFSPGPDLWELVCSDSDVCLRVNCNSFRDCFFHQARREALDAQLLIVNHSLLFADIALRSRGADTGVLPEYHAIVFDEAHNIENIATGWLGASVTRLSFSRLLARLWSARQGGRAKGVLATVEHKLLATPELHPELVRGINNSIHQELSPAIMLAMEQVNTLYSDVENYLASGARESKTRLTPDFISRPGWKRIQDRVTESLGRIEDLSQLLESFHNRLENLGPHGFETVLAQALELNSARARLSGLETSLREIIFGTNDSLVRWVELGNFRAGPRAVFNFAPLSVSRTLREHVWEKYSSVLFTSATMTVDKSFQYLRERLGLDSELKVMEMQYDSPFDYRNRVLLGIASDMPPPEDRQFVGQIAPAVLSSLCASRGRALVLFTSFSLLKSTAAALGEDLEAMGIPMLWQGQMPRHTLLEKFRSDIPSVLLATSSFWEGVDVAGESLSSVILTRLPFTVPDDPVMQARMEDLRSRGKNPFYSYQVPQAVLRFKQGFGRLIRTKQDLGVVLVLDKRIVSKNYGRLFINSLPACPIKSGALMDILSWHKEFLDLNK
jgi:ATP-dependent DNA helicase DinG